MQPKEAPCHIRIKHEPTQKQLQRECRLYGKDFINMAEAARHWKINYSWAVEQINNGWNRENFPPKARRKYV
tara:strand:+ start:356 stop:571 length:216 start_codon:yes stop_codon:yes gene_type:complete